MNAVNRRYLSQWARTMTAGNYRDDVGPILCACTRNHKRNLTQPHQTPLQSSTTLTAQRTHRDFAARRVAKPSQVYVMIRFRRGQTPQEVLFVPCSGITLTLRTQAMSDAGRRGRPCGAHTHTFQLAVNEGRSVADAVAVGR